jgi:hypothetical protein
VTPRTLTHDDLGLALRSNVVLIGVLARVHAVGREVVLRGKDEWALKVLWEALE